MPRTVAKLRQSVRRARRTMSFQRPAPPDRQPHADRPPPRAAAPAAESSRFVRPSRSFPNLSAFVERGAARLSRDHDDPSAPAHDHPFDPTAPDTPETISSHNLSFRPSSPVPSAPQPLSTSTISTTSSISTTAPVSTTNVPHTDTQHPPEHTLPPPNKRLLRRISSSQRVRRLSIGHRARPRNPRCSSFSEPPRPWASGGTSLLSHRSDTDDSLSWGRHMSRSSDTRLWGKRHASYSCSDFEVAEEHTIVEIGARLPDRTDRVAEEDVFGRRRGDFLLKNGDSMVEAAGKPLFACDVSDVEEDCVSGDSDLHTHLRDDPTLTPPPMANSNLTDDNDEETLKNIAKAIDSSKGRLRRSANMSNAFRAVIKSGEGLVRKSELVQATLNSDECKDPSMIILLDPDSCDPSNPHLEGVSTTSEESSSADNVSGSNAVPNASVGFSTSMTAKQCAATLETILRDMSCKVSRYADEQYGAQSLIRLKATRIPNGVKAYERKLKVMVTIREEDRIRTSVAFRRVAGWYSSRDSHIPFCSEIRDRFQREWPAVVEALYIRLPNVANAQPSL